MVRSFAVLSLVASCLVLAAPPKKEPAMQKLTFGKPVSLAPEQSASGEGLTLRNEGYGHKIDMDGSDIAFIEVLLKAGTEELSARFWREKDATPVRWKGYEIRMTACEDQGPPHSRTAKTTFVVVKAPPGED